MDLGMGLGMDRLIWSRHRVERPRQCLNARPCRGCLVTQAGVGRLARIGRQFSFLGVLQGVGGFRGMFVADLGGEVAMGLRR